MEMKAVQNDSKEKRLEYYFKMLELPYGQRPHSYVLLEQLGLTEEEAGEYQRQKDSEVSMKPGKKRDLAVKEVVRPLLKAAGFKGRGLGWWKELDDSWLLIHMDSSHFNSASSGANFSFRFSASRKDEVRDTVERQWIYNQLCSLTQSNFLPYCGYLSPYISGSSYKIDGYRNYLPKDEPLESIETQMREDFQDYILPQLEPVRTKADWDGLRARLLARYEEKEIRLLVYYHLARDLACSENNRHRLMELQKEQRLTAEDITGHFDWLKIIEKHSAFPSQDTRPYILETLSRAAES